MTIVGDFLVMMSGKRICDSPPMTDEDDPVIQTMPIHLSTKLDPSIHVHQYPLMSRSLQPPPSAIAAGKRITARLKPTSKRIEVHIPSDTRAGYWNTDKAHDLGAALVRDDREKNQTSESQSTSTMPRLDHVRMRSEQIPIKGAYMIGVIRAGVLHLHPINEMHQLRPTLTYLDAATSKKRKGANDEDDSDESDGPPPDPDEAPSIPTLPKKRERKIDPTDMKEVQVAARKTDTEPTGRGGSGAGGGAQGLSLVRREMLQMLRTEEDEGWQGFDFYPPEVSEASLLILS